LKSGSLNLLEPSRPVQACNGIALPFTNGYMQGKNKGMEDNRLQGTQSKQKQLVISWNKIMDYCEEYK
jgi:hypothetical protein